MLGMAYSRYFFRPSQFLNLVGKHEYSHHPLLKKADDWARRTQDYRDRPWIAERETMAQAATEAANL